jgi:hypothetical protein
LKAERMQTGSVADISEPNAIDSRKLNRYKGLEELIPESFQCSQTST